MNNTLRRLFGFDYADEKDIAPRTRRGLTFFYWDAVFALFSESSSANYVNLFLVSLNASNTQIGFLATITQIVSAIAPLPGAAIAERTGRYRANILIPSLVARIFWFVLALLPFLPLGPAVVGIAITIFAARMFMYAWLQAPWTAFVGRLVPTEIRASYLSMRNFGGGLATIAGTALAAWIISLVGEPGGFQVIFVISGIVGMAAQWAFSSIPFDERTPIQSEPTPARTSIDVTRIARNVRSMLTSNPTWTRILICDCVLALAVGIGGPFIQVYQIRELGFGAAAVGLMVTAELATNIVMQRVYGTYIVPRFGELTIMRFLRPLTSLVPFLWLFATTPVMGLPIVFLAGTLWSGHELCSFNTQLRITPEDGRANYIALHMFAISLFAAVGPAIGGAVVDAVGFFPLFAVSAGLRLAAGILLHVVVPRNAA
jgi:MFS family permease